MPTVGLVITPAREIPGVAKYLRGDLLAIDSLRVGLDLVRQARCSVVKTILFSLIFLTAGSSDRRYQRAGRNSTRVRLLFGGPRKSRQAPAGSSTS